MFWMKNNIKFIASFLIILLCSCDSKNANDCFQTAGAIIQKEVKVGAFSKILATEEVILILKQGTTQQVIIETGENLLNDVEAYVEEGRLILNNNNSCNYVRDYELTKIYVTSPDLTEIRCATNRYIKSEGILAYPNLTILSEDSQSNYLISGDVELALDSEKVSVVANGTSIFRISGKAMQLSIVFASNNCRFEGGNFIVDQIDLSHSSSNDIIVNPQIALRGIIYSTGDVISKNQPNIIEVEQRYKGKLIIAK